jgi:hypothetical protein
MLRVENNGSATLKVVILSVYTEGSPSIQNAAFFKLVLMKNYY